MTRVHALPIAAVFAVLLQGACGREPVPPTRIGTFPVPANEPVFLAQDRGWLSPSDVRLVEFINDGEVMRAFRNGSIEAGFVTIDELLLLVESGIDPVILFVAAESRGADTVIAHADVGSLSDLRGRRVAVQVSSAGAYLLRRGLQASGLSVNEVQVVNLPPDRHRAAFLARTVDAVVTSEPVRSQLLAAKGVELFSSASLPLELVAVMVARRDYLQQHVERISSLCNSWRRAEEELRSSPAARQWVAARMRITPDALNEMLDVVRLTPMSESHLLLSAPRPRLLATAARIQSALVDAGLLPNPIPLEPIFAWPVSVDSTSCRG